MPHQLSLASICDGGVHKMVKPMDFDDDGKKKRWSMSTPRVMKDVKRSFNFRQLKQLSGLL
jgi:hypothetical protein